MMEATATLSLELFMRARRRFQAVGLRQEVQLNTVPAFSLMHHPYLEAV